MPEITIAIASIGRESLIRTLVSFTQLKPMAETRLRVVIADDSRDGAAARRVQELGECALDITVLPVAAGNIAVARNALLDGASGDALVFVDDDEWVAPDWLEKLLACQREFRADVVIGPVFPVYPDNAPQWMRQARPHYVDWGPRGKRLLSGRGGNTLVALPFIRKLGIRFEPGLGQTGGEDTDFFSRAAARGAVIIATDDAIASEHVPAERLSVSYLLRRAQRSGQSYADSRKTDHPTLGWKLLFMTDASAKVAVATLLWLALSPLGPARAFRMRQKLHLNLGKLRSVFNLPLARLYG